MTNLITRKQAAALLGVSPQAIDKARRAGRITYADPAKRLFDPLALEAQWHGNRRRQRAPRAVLPPDTPAGDPAAPADDSVPALLHRRLKAEVALIEHKARTGGGVRLPTAAVERALRLFYTHQRARLDALGMEFVELVADDLTPERYRAVYPEAVRIGRQAAVATWMELLSALSKEFPAWSLEFASRFAAAERGTNPAPEVRARLGLPPLTS